MGMFVTGASGSLGLALVEELVAAGHAVTGLVRSPDGERRLRDAGAEPLRGDLQDAAALTAGANGADTAVLVDRRRTDQVLADLLVDAANARARRVRIAASTGGRARVSDDGPGIPADSREAVFERLVRLDAARSTSTGGAGLGLPIACGLAEAQGGSLRAVDPGEDDLTGAVFELRLPLAPAAVRDAVVRAPTS